MNQIINRTAHLTFAQATDTGKVRNANQDAALAFFVRQSSAAARPDFGLFAVADGMGPSPDGEKAADLGVQVLAGCINREVYAPLSTRRMRAEELPAEQILLEAFQETNNHLSENVPEGVTTITAALLLGGEVTIAHVGSSRAYWISKGKVEKLTHDHTMIQHLVNQGQITAEEARNHPQRHVLYQALGQGNHIKVDTVTRRFHEEAYVLLCTDGLWLHIKEREIYETVFNAEGQVQSACDKLVTLAKLRGGVDNITAVIIAHRL
ncbi:MAG: protein phosphatase 2C domain-containing protein [Anaerolineae bacterium]